MLNIMSEENTAHLLSFSARKKVAFLILLYERMTPELRSFCLAESRDFSLFQKADEQFWQWLVGSDSSISWGQLREEILNAAPDSEDFGTIEASFALNAALVAADIAGFIEDGQNSHIVEAIGYARDSLDANAINEMGAIVFDRTADGYVKAHPLVQRELQQQADDLKFLESLPTDIPQEMIPLIEEHAQQASGLLSPKKSIS